MERTSKTIDYARLPKGKIVVKARPPGTEVFFGAEKVGRAPFDQSVVVGAYTVKLVRGKRSKTFNIDVKPKARALIQHTW